MGPMDVWLRNTKSTLNNTHWAALSGADKFEHLEKEEEEQQFPSWHMNELTAALPIL